MVESFGSRVARLRSAAGFTQAGLAEAADIPLTTLRNWERGRRLPYLDAALVLAQALGVTLDELAGELAGLRQPVDEKARGRPMKTVAESVEPKTAGRPRKTPAPVAEESTTVKTRKGK
jgi:transcriptional regulator with XRE-family HTH domain